MAKKWYHNALTGEVDSYNVDGEWTDFPRGTWLAYGDFITTGLESKEEAEQWAQDWHACKSCRQARAGKKGDTCSICGTELV